MTSKPPTSGDKADRAALRERLDELLSAINLIRDWPDLAQYDLISALLSVRGPWRSHLTPIDLYTVLARALRRRGISGAEATGQKLIKLVDAEAFSALRADIESYLLSFPRQYNLWVALPAMPRWGVGSIKFSEQIQLVEKEVPQLTTQGLLASALRGQQPSPFAPEAKSATKVYLRVSATGYGSGPGTNSTAVSEAISLLKQFVQMFRRLKVFRRLNNFRLMIGPPNPECWIEDLQYPEERESVQLPHALASFLWTASLNEDELKVPDTDVKPGQRASTLLTAGERAPRTRQEREWSLTQSMSWILRLLSCPQSEDIDRIRSALEWEFDSDEGDNQTLSLLQACIGLEAMLGDDDKDEPLMARLKDRCAYLLGKNFSDREDIRRRFGMMYGVRSKVIHGRSRRLSMSDAQQLQYAQELLGKVITEEANRLLRNLK